jgi:NADPH2:quinone reductase
MRATMMKAIRIHRYGDPGVLALEDVPTPEPGPGQVLVRIEAAGINFMDAHQRAGSYPGPLPFTPGVEAAGVVAALGPGADGAGVRVGDRVAIPAAPAPGTYAEYIAVSAAALVPLPDDLDARQAAAVMLPGITAHTLAAGDGAYPARAGDTVLVHSAAGGVGLLLTQMVARAGARVIGTVSREEKAAAARDAGADEVIVRGRVDFASEARRLTGGRGVDAVYDGIGKDTVAAGLDALRPRGTMVVYGAASGPAPAIEPATLGAKGSLFLTHVNARDYAATPAEAARRLGEIFGWVRSGDVRLRIERAFPLAEAATAHRLLESGATVGKLLLIP